MLPYRRTPRTEQDAHIDPSMAGVWLESKNRWHAASPIFTLLGLLAAAAGFVALLLLGVSYGASLAH